MFLLFGKNYFYVKKTSLQGCLQYHVGLTGRIETFNFAAGGTSVHLVDQRYYKDEIFPTKKLFRVFLSIRYSVCLRPERGFCCVRYQVQDSTIPFKI